MVDVKASEQTLWRFNAIPNYVLGVWILRLNGQDQIVRSENYYSSSIKVASIDKNKNSHRKITMTHTLTTCQTASLFVWVKKEARPAEIGALASVFKKSATVLKLKQKLLKCKRSIQLETFNVRTLNRIGIREHRSTHREDTKYHDTSNLWTSLKSLNSIEKIQPKMMVAIFNGNPSTTIISCYKSTNGREETDRIIFYNELSSLVQSIPKHNVLVSGGAMNAQIGKNVNHKFSLHNSSSRNEEHLIDFSLENRLTCRNIKFQKRKKKTMDLHLRK